jgi:thiamine biosynthesis protein ThiS
LHGECTLPIALQIILNGEPFTVDAPLTISELLSRLEIDPRIVAVEHNLTIIKRDRQAATTIEDGDEIEVVKFVGGG